jgi:hypothetical protein
LKHSSHGGNDEMCRAELYIIALSCFTPRSLYSEWIVIIYSFSYMTSRYWSRLHRFLLVPRVCFSLFNLYFLVRFHLRHIRDVGFLHLPLRSSCQSIPGQFESPDRLEFRPTYRCCSFVSRSTPCITLVLRPALLVPVLSLTTVTGSESPAVWVAFRRV